MALRIPLTLARYALALLSAALIGFGFVASAVPLINWLGQENNRLAYLAAVVCASLALLAIRWRLPRSHPGRLISAVAAGVSISLLLFLAAIAGYIDLRERAYVTAMKSDLRNLRDVQIELHETTGRYTEQPSAESFRWSTGVTNPRVRVTADGWSASVSHARTERTCLIFGGRTPLPPATESGAPECTPARFKFAEYLPGLGMMAAGAVVALLVVFVDAKTRAPGYPPRSVS
jgi:hypothetical protein